MFLRLSLCHKIHKKQLQKLLGFALLSKYIDRFLFFGTAFLKLINIIIAYIANFL